MTDTSPAALLLRAAADKLRALAEQAERDIRENPSWESTVIPPNDYPSLWARGVDNALGGPAGALAAAMGPSIAYALADLLGDLADGDGEGVVNPWAEAAARAVLGQHAPKDAQEPHSAPSDPDAARAPERPSDRRTGDRGVTHACPPEGSGLMPCCGRTPFEAPRTDRITTDPAAVTCRPAPAGLPDWIRKGTRSPGHPVCKTSPKGASKAAPDNGWSAERHAGHGSPCETSPNGSCAEAATDDGLREQYAAAIIAGGGCVDLKAATDAVVSVRDRHMEQLAAGRDELATAGAALAGVRELASRWRHQQDRRSAREELLAALNITRLADPAHALTCTARDREGHLYVLDDRSRSMGADVWGTEVCQLAIERQADAIVVETNYGGDMARQNVVQAWQQLEREGLTNGKLMPRIITVNAKQGKRLRGGEPQ